MKKLVAGGAVVVVVLLLAFAWHHHARETDRTAAARGSGAIVAGRASATPVVPASLAGRVVKADGSGVAGAIVSLSKVDFSIGAEPTTGPMFATTDGSGAWTIAALEPGRYSASAQARGFVPGHVDKLVIASGEQRTGVLITLAPGGTIVSGTVSDVGGGPIAEARVIAHPEDRSPTDTASYVAITGKDGHYELALGDGTYRLVAEHDDYTSRNDTVEVAGSAVTHDFVLTPGAVIRGVVIARDTNKPVAGAIVTAEAHHISDKHAVAPTDAEGAFTIRGLHSGAISITAAGRGYASAQPTTVEVGIGEQIDNVRIVVDKAYTISGTVVKRGTKDPLPNVGVGAFAMSAGKGNEHNATGPSDDQGRWEIVGVRPGTFTLFAFGEEAVPNIGKSVQVVDKDVSGIEIEIEGGVTISGKVTPPEAAAVTLELAGEIGIANLFDAMKTFMVHGDTDPATGAFTLHNVPSGAFKLVAKATAGSIGKLPIAIAAADQRDLVIPLEVRASIAGKVVDTTGAPVANASVNAKRTDDDHPETIMMMNGGPRGATTRADGTFTLLSLEAGEYEMHASASGDEGFESFTVAARDTKKKPLTVRVAVGDARTGVVISIPAENGVIRGQVQDTNNQPVADTWVTARRMPELPADVAGKNPVLDDEMANTEWWSSSEPVLTGADGKFAITKLRDATYLVVAEGPRGASRAEKKSVKPGDVITIQLAALGTLTGHVTNAGAPVVGYTIDCKGPAGDADRSSAASDGAYSLEHLAPGPYTCRVEGDAGTAVGKIEVPAGPATLDLALTPWSALTGQIVNMFDRTALANVMVVASSASANPGAFMIDAIAGTTPKSDASGHFVINKVSVGKGQVMVLDNTGFKPLATKDYDVANGQRLDLGAIEIVPPRTGDAGTFGMSTEVTSDGLKVAQVKDGGPAASAGIVVGDVITSMAGQPIKSDKASLAQTYLSSGSIGIGVTVQLGLARGQMVAVTSIKW